MILRFTKTGKLTATTLLFLMLSASFGAIGQTTIFNVAGGGALPSGWTGTNNVAAQPIDQSTYYLVDPGATSDVITTAVYDLSAYTSASFTIDVATYGSGGNNPAKIEISYNGGTSYTQTATTTTPTSTSYIAGGPIALTSVSNQVRIKISNNATSGKSVRLRNIKLTASGSATVPLITLVGTSLSFGNQCTGTNSTEQSYTVAGAHLTNNIAINAPTGFQVSITSGSGFTNSLSLTQSSGTVAATTIYVRYNPASTGASGALNITHASTGATTQNVGVSGTGVNSAPSVTAGSVSPIGFTTASPAGTISATGCTAVTAYGIEYSTVNGFANGAGTQVASSNLGSGDFSSGLSGLTPGTVYYFKVYATNGGGTAYSTQGTFTTLKSEPTAHAGSFGCGTTTVSGIPLSWTAATGQDGYLVKWSDVGLASITDPVDGTAAANTVTSQVATSASLAATISGLLPNTTYYFKIYPYSNSGSNTDYRIAATVPSTSCTTLDGPCLTEGFNGGITPPSGWTFTAIGGTYTSGGNYGTSSPSLKLDADNDRIETPALAGTASALSFWIKGQGTNASSGLLVEGWNGSAWVTIQNITNSLPIIETTKTYNAGTTPALPSGLSKFRFTYSQGAGNLAFDDIEVYCASVCTVPVDVTAQTTLNCVSAGTTVSWTNSTCYDEVLVVATSGSFGATTPSGDGTAYTSNASFTGSGTVFDGGKVVYKGAANTVNVTGLTNGVTYTFKIFTRKGTAWSTGVTTSCTPVISYCTASSDDVGVEFIDRVTFNTIDNGSSGDFMYQDWTAQSTTVEQGSSYQLTVYATDAFSSDQVKVYIDWNGDGNFTGVSPAEAIGTSAMGAGPYTFNILIPATATLGTTRMRIRLEDSDYTTADDCGISDFGEVEDYTLNIVVPCVPVGAITSFMPASGPAATLVTITGTGFTGSTAVRFGEVNATSFTVVNSTTIIAEVPAGVSPSVTISVADGSSCAAVSSGTFTFVSYSGTCAVSATDLILSEIFDGQTGNTQYIEIYNGTGAAINLATPNQYKLNVSTNPSDLSLNGTIANGATLVVYAGSDGDNKATFSGSFSNGFNDDDYIRLKKGSTVIDEAETPSFVGSTMIRKANIVSPSSTYTGSQWTITDHNSATSGSTIGSHTMNAVNLAVITASPADVSGCLLTMSVTSSTSGVGYQWKFNDPATMNGWMNVSTGNIPAVVISGETTASLMITGSVSGLDKFQFYCEVYKNGCANASNAAQIDYNVRPIYRSKAAVNGNWSDYTNWEMSYDGVSYVSACSYPESANSSEAIIQTGTRVVLDLASNIDKLTIEFNAELEMSANAKLTVYDSTAGADLLVNGTLTDRNNFSNTMSLESTATWQLGANGMVVKTGNAEISQYKDNYEGGMSGIPATANWIFRHNATDGNPTVGSEGYFYPNLFFENAAAGNFSWNDNLMAFSGSAGITTVKGNLELGTSGAGTVTVYNNNTNASPFLVLGNVTIASGSALSSTSCDGVVSAGTGFELKGSLTVNGTMTVLDGSTEKVLKLTGTTVQNIAGSGTIDLYKMTVDKSAQYLLLQRNLQVQNELVMTQGHIYTGTNFLELGLSTAQTGILSHVSGFVVGKMRRWFNSTNSGDASGLFPMGVDDSGLKNRNTKIEYTSAAALGGHLTVEFIGSPMGTSGLIILAANSHGAGFDVLTTEDQGYWKIDNEPGTLTDGEYTISCTGEGFATVTNTNITLLKRVIASSANWFCPGMNVTPTGIPAMPVVARTGVTGWSNFGFGGGVGSPLPVELISFSGVCEDDIVLSWATASEKNSDYFILERSQDMKNWTTVSQVPAAGNSSQVQHYHFTDKDSPRGVAYYRLVQVDYNGIGKTYSPVSVECSADEKDYFILYPNPSIGAFTVEWNIENLAGNAEVTLTSSTGALISRRMIDASEGAHIVPFNEDLDPGLYYVTLKSEEGVRKVLKVIVR